MTIATMLQGANRNRDAFGEAIRTRNPRVLLSLLGPALRGLVMQNGKAGDSIDIETSHRVHFNWNYQPDHAELRKLYEAAKRSQWNASTDIDWSINVDPYDTTRDLFPESMLPVAAIPQYRGLSQREQLAQRAALMSWMLSQFLHGEQGALFAACQVTEAVQWFDGKLYGSTQVVDEGRHVEVFQRYLSEKLGRLYEINDNLYVLIDALMSDNRWDIKFLGMQIMIEGLALGAFGALRAATSEPLLKNVLRYVITDEARHVHYGVVALRDFYRELPERELREREDWAFEVAVLLRNRFLAHEFYDEYYGHLMSRRTWNQLVLTSPYMEHFRKTMFRRLVPNLKRIGLLSDRIRPHYESLGLLAWEHGKAAPELTADDLLSDS